MDKYSIECKCGYTAKGNDKRNVEANMWHHAIHDHNDMVKSMTVEQFTGIMKEWDKSFESM